MQETQQPNGKLEQIFEDGCRVVTFPNGTRRHYLPDGRTQLHFSNGDCKCQHVNGTSRPPDLMDDPHFKAHCLLILICGSYMILLVPLLSLT